MDRSNTQKKKSSQIPGNKELKKKETFRNPLREVKISNASTSSGGGSSSLSSSVSVETGCLRFFLSHSSSAKTPFSNCRLEKSKALSKTPKSAPISRPNNPFLKSKPLIKHNSSKKGIFEAPILQKPRKVEKLQPQFPRKPRSKIGGKSKDVILLNSNGSSVNKSSFRSQSTPVTKLGNGLVLDCGGDVDIDEVMEDAKSKDSGSSSSKTPPIQASLSPEIQCGSNVMPIKVKTPACYAAGHVIAGVTDKRKCRPRGVLAVGDFSGGSSSGKPKALNIFDDDNEDCGEEIGGDSRLSMVPSPVEASMHWLLSPCREEDETDKENSGIRSGGLRVGRKTVNSPSSPLSDLAFSLDLCNIGSIDGRASRSGRKYLLSPSEVPQYRGYLDSLCESVVVSSPNAMPCDGKQRYDFDGGDSPFSMDSLGTENMIQTPESESSSGKRVGFSYLSANARRKDTDDFQPITAAEDVRRASLSLNSRVSNWDTTNSSFQFDHLPSACSSVDLSQFQRVLEDPALWKSDSTMENLSHSQMRVSWREGLASRMFDMDDLDSCRCFSDEEEDFKFNNSNPLKPIQTPSNNDNATNGSNDAFRSTEFVDNKLPTGVKTLPSCAESFSTDGGGLISSEDSNWSHYYKNSLFKS